MNQQSSQKTKHVQIELNPDGGESSKNNKYDSGITLPKKLIFGQELVTPLKRKKTKPMEEFLESEHLSPFFR